MLNNGTAAACKQSAGKQPLLMTSARLGRSWSGGSIRAGEPQEHFHTVILTAEEDCENAQDGCGLIDLEIIDGSVFGHPTKIGEKIRPERALERGPSECLHVILDRSDPGCRPLERLVGRITKILIGFEEMIENQRQIVIAGNGSKDFKVHVRDAFR